jgi:cephalosporin-C deacetylase-like acetyl esterase
MKTFLQKFLTFCCISAISAASLAQGSGKSVQIQIRPDHADWRYKTGEEAVFTVNITRFAVPLDGVKVKYTLGYEKQAPFKTDEIIVKNGQFQVKAEGMKVPGFLTCRVSADHDGFRYSNLAQVGYEPENIRPASECPADFNRFWDRAKAENAKIPLNPIMTLMPEWCTSTVDVYHVSVQNYSVNAKIYGMLCIPRQAGKYPAVLRVPGAGVARMRPEIALSEKGMIVFSIGIHGIPQTLPDQAYPDLANGALKGYQYFNLDDRDNYYYKRVFLGCSRAVDFLFTLEQFDGKNMAVWGGSQGGGLSLVTAGLDKRIKYYVCFYPALCDHAGYLKGRAGGWPHLFYNTVNKKPEKIETARYYDAVNFAGNITAAGFFSFGYNDLSCPVTSIYAAYNTVSAPKDIYLSLENGHWRYPEQDKKAEDWLLNQFKKNK